MDANERLLNRFCQYVQIDTQSREGAKTYPSTEGQRVLGRILGAELELMGLDDVLIDQYGYVTATIPASAEEKDRPVVGFFAHLDTAPNLSGKNVRPLIHRGYSGQDIRLTNTVRIRKDDHPDLAKQIGHDIISADGSTLLGADNKAGVAAIMEMAQRLMEDKAFPHGPVRIAFTPDEEIGRGVEFFDLEAFGADFAYTVDGEAVGQIDNETFIAQKASIEIKGIDIHPGSAKGKMINAIKVASFIVDYLPVEEAPESTDDRNGFIHPVSISGTVGKARIKLILRAFEPGELMDMRDTLKNILKAALLEFPKVKIDLHIVDQYDNMRFELDKHPEVLEIALAAMRMAGLDPKLGAIRGGTDGAMLAAKGLPAPNIFTGGHAFHSREEWISLQDMEKTVEVLLNIVKITGRGDQRVN